MLLSIIIVNYNTFELTCNCIRSIRETTGIDYEIILVDNDSKECDPDEFLRVFPGLRLIKLKENVGFGRANNRGVQESKGKYVLLLNSDTIVNPGTINETVDYLETHPNVDVLGCKVLLENKVAQNTVFKYEGENKITAAVKYLIKRNSFFVAIRLFCNSLLSGKSKLVTRPNTSAPIPVRAQEVELNVYNGAKIGLITGVFLLLKRGVYLETKGFDPDFFMYFEETEWFANRLSKYNLVYYHFATIIHFHGGSDVYHKMNLQFYASSYLFWYKMGYVQGVLYFLYMLAEIPSRLLVKLFFRKSRLSKDLGLIIATLPYFFKVLQYPNKFGSRDKMLKLEYLQKRGL